MDRICALTSTLTGARPVDAAEHCAHARVRVRRAVIRHVSSQVGSLLSAVREWSRARHPQGSAHLRSRDVVRDVVGGTAECRTWGKNSLSPSSCATGTASDPREASAGENSLVPHDAIKHHGADKANNHRIERGRGPHRLRTSPSHSGTNLGRSASWRITCIG